MPENPATTCLDFVAEITREAEGSAIHASYFVTVTTKVENRPTISMFPNTHYHVHWRIDEKPTDFNPIQRWSNWSADQHRRFNSIAGEEMAYLEYDLVTGSA